LAKLEIVGVGPGSPDYVTLAAKKAVQSADLIIGAQRSVALFSGEIKGETVVLTAENLQDLLKKAAELVKAGKTVVLLSTGDPGFSGLLHTVLESGLFQEKDICVIPGVSSIQACAARLNISWDNTRLFTFHEGDVSDDAKGRWYRHINADAPSCCCLLQRVLHPKTSQRYYWRLVQTKKPLFMSAKTLP
jgi:cobalt-precorrin-7 (C5)-methyltransferase